MSRFRKCPRGFLHTHLAPQGPLTNTHFLLLTLSPTHSPTAPHPCRAYP
jgi:hypothetical protein